MKNVNMQNEIDKVIYSEEIKLGNHVVDKKIEACNFVRNLCGVIAAGSLTSAFLNSGGGDGVTALVSGGIALASTVGAYMASEKAKRTAASREELVQKHIQENLKFQRGE